MRQPTVPELFAILRTNQPVVVDESQLRQLCYYASNRGYLLEEERKDDTIYVFLVPKKKEVKHVQHQ